MKKVILIILVMLFSGCLLSEKKMSSKLNISDTNKISSSFTGGDFSYGTTLEIPIITKEIIAGMSFDVVYNKEKYELIKIEKTGMSTENIVFSYPNTAGSKIVVYDMKQSIAKGSQFLKIYMKVKWYGKEAITIKNIKTK